MVVGEATFAEADSKLENSQKMKPSRPVGEGPYARFAGSAVADTDLERREVSPRILHVLVSWFHASLRDK